MPVAPQYRTWGAPPPAELVDTLMAHLDREYYVGWLSASELLGAAHQRPQVFQVAVDASIAARRIGWTLGVHRPFECLAKAAHASAGAHRVRLGFHP